MKHTKLKSVLQMIVILTVMAGLLLCLNGCKKKKPDSTQAPTQTTGASTDTQPSVTTTPTTLPATKPTTPPETTLPSETTAPTEETIPPCDHVLGNWMVEKPSTCTTEGSRYKECTLCKAKVETEVIAKIAHSPGNWIVDKKATCQAQGQQHLECTQCKEKLLYITVGKADHSVKTMAGYAATATTPGRTDRLECKSCDTTVQQSYVIPVVGSVNYTFNVNSDGKSCTVTGVTGFSGKELILPATLDGHTVSAIGDKAFANLTGISTLYIPKSVTRIGSRAFSGCLNLTNITYQGTTNQWNTLPKGAEWNTNTGSYTVYCTNTSLAK